MDLDLLEKTSTDGGMGISEGFVEAKLNQVLNGIRETEGFEAFMLSGNIAWLAGRFGFFNIPPLDQRFHHIDFPNFRPRIQDLRQFDLIDGWEQEKHIDILGLRSILVENSCQYYYVWKQDKKCDRLNTTRIGIWGFDRTGNQKIGLVHFCWGEERVEYSHGVQVLKVYGATKEEYSYIVKLKGENEKGWITIPDDFGKDFYLAMQKIKGPKKC